jgi:hypothetical protein
MSLRDPGSKLIAACFIAIGCAACTSQATISVGSTTPAVATNTPTGTSSTGVTISPSGGTPTSSPGITGSVTMGQATIAVSGGGISADVTLTQLGTPAVWAAPPAGIVLSWTDTSGHQNLTLSGTAFVGSAPTSSTFGVTFTVITSKGSETFASSSGECNVDFLQAAANNLSGTFSCPRLASPLPGAVTASGSFSATG